MVVLPAPFGPSRPKHLAALDVEVEPVDGFHVGVVLLRDRAGDGQGADFRHGRRTYYDCPRDMRAAMRAMLLNGFGDEEMMQSARSIRRRSARTICAFASARRR